MSKRVSVVSKEHCKQRLKTKHILQTESLSRIFDFGIQGCLTSLASIDRDNLWTLSQPTRSLLLSKISDTEMEPAPSGDVEDTLKRINSHPGVLGLIVLNPQGLAIKSTMDNATTQLYASNFQHLTSLARSCVRDLDPLNDLKFLRVRSRKYEIMVAPSGDYSLIVIQNPNQKDL